MSMIISDDCISCDVCESECPNDAISLGEEYYRVDPAKCTECVGHYDEPQCTSVCPVDCISIDKSKSESREELQAKYEWLKSR